MKKIIIALISAFTLSGCANLQAGADHGMWSLCNYPAPYIYGVEKESNLCARLYRQFHNLSDEEATKLYRRYNNITDEENVK